MGGPYFVDSNDDGLIDESDTPQSDGAMGFVLRNLDFALALFKPVNPAIDKSSYYAIRATGGAEVVGIDGLTIRADLLGVEVNGGKNNAGLRRRSPRASPSVAADGACRAERARSGRPRATRAHDHAESRRRDQGYAAHDISTICLLQRQLRFVRAPPVTG